MPEAKRRGLRRVLIFGTPVVLGLAAWVVFPHPFARGIVVGALGGLLTFFGGVFLMARRLGKRMEGRLAPPPLPTGSWDYAMGVEDLAGHAVDTAGLRGSVVILNFWATWCAPCVAEMPSLVRLHEATADLGVEMMCLTSEPRDVVARFVEKRGLAAPVYRTVGDPPEAFTTRSIPATFIVDKTGTIALRHVGAATWDDDKVVTFVRGLAIRETG